MGKPDNIDPRPHSSPEGQRQRWVSDPRDYPTQIHREHFNPLAAAKGFVYGFLAGSGWTLLMFYLFI